EGTMPGNRRIGWASPLLKSVAVLGVLLAGVGAVYLWQTPNQAEAAMLSAHNAGGFKAKGKLLITIGVSNPEQKELAGTLKVELLDAKGKSVGKAEKEVRQKEAAASYRLELPLTGLPADQVTLRCHLGDREEFTAKVSELLLAKEHETSLSSGQEFVAGSTASLRCTVQGVKSLTETMPHSGAEVRVWLKGADKASGVLYRLYEGKTGADGPV